MDLTAQDIQSIRLFQGLDPNQRAELFEVSKRHKFAPNKAVLNEGEVGMSLFVILGGSVRVSKKIKGELAHLATLVTGDFFGEMALLEKSTRTATVMTLEDSVILEFEMARLDDLFSRNPNIGLVVYQNLARGLSERLRSFIERVKEISWREE